LNPDYVHAAQGELLADLNLLNSLFLARLKISTITVQDGV
jgi:hypothetical protein